MLRINIQSENGTAILYCSGRIVFGMEAETLRTITRSRLEPSIQIDLGQVETVDASGLGLLVELQQWARREHRQLRFQNASEFVGRLITITRLNDVLCLPAVSLPHGSDGCGYPAVLSA